MQRITAAVLICTVSIATGFSPHHCRRTNAVQFNDDANLQSSFYHRLSYSNAALVDTELKRASSSPTNGLVRISESPLAFVDETFLDASECSVLIQLAKSKAEAGFCDVAIRPEENDIMASVLRRVSDLCSSETHPDEPKPNVRNTPPNRGLEQRGRWMNRGLHLDTNGNPYRYATILIYLSDVDMDGATVFPCSDPSKSNLRAAGEALTDKGQTIAARRQREDKEIEALEKTLIDAAESMEGLSVYPKVGKLLLFYSLCDNGVVDPYSWHGGAAVGNEPGEGKWLLQIFKTVPIGLRTQENMGTFVQPRRYMHEKSIITAKSHYQELRATAETA
jgi:hypothetical protein